MSPLTVVEWWVVEVFCYGTRWRIINEGPLSREEAEHIAEGWERVTHIKCRARKVG